MSPKVAPRQFDARLTLSKCLSQAWTEGKCECRHGKRHMVRGSCLLSDVPSCWALLRERGSPGVRPYRALGARHAARGRRSVPVWGVASRPGSGRQCTPGDAPSRQDTVNVWSFFGQRRCLDSDRVAALSCLECTSPAPTRLDENRTVSRPFPNHVSAPFLVPAQQR
jgi:hypothetical protein